MFPKGVDNFEIECKTFYFLMGCSSPVRVQNGKKIDALNSVTNCGAYKGNSVHHEHQQRRPVLSFA